MVEFNVGDKLCSVGWPVVGVNVGILGVNVFRAYVGCIGDGVGVSVRSVGAVDGDGKGFVVGVGVVPDD